MNQAVRVAFAEHMQGTAPELIGSVRFAAEGAAGSTLSVGCDTIQQALLVIAAATAVFTDGAFYEGLFDRIELSDGQRTFVVTGGAPLAPPAFESVAPNMGDDGAARAFFAATSEANTSLPFHFAVHGRNNSTLRISVDAHRDVIVALGVYGSRMTPSGFVEGADFETIEVYDGACLYVVRAAAEGS